MEEWYPERGTAGLSALSRLSAEKHSNMTRVMSRTSCSKRIRRREKVGAGRQEELERGKQKKKRG